MGLASFLTLSFAVVALCAAGFNLWILRQRPQEKNHLWLAVAALGVLGSSVPAALLYASDSAEGALWLRQAMVLCFLPLAFGFVRFSSGFLSVELRRTERLASGFVLAFLLLSFVPGFSFTGEAAPRSIALLGETYVDAEIALPGKIASLGFLVFVLHLFAVYRRHLPGLGESTRALSAAVGVWLMCVANDLGVGAGRFDMPYLMGMGYAGFVVAFTSVLTRRFTRSMEQVEQSAERLQELVETRTAELRDKELELAHDDRMAILGTVAAGLAHEINNPIAFISANLNHLSELLKCPEEQAEIEDVLDETREGVERIRALAAELLRLARRGEGTPEPVDLGRMVESVLPIVRHEARGRARLTTRLAPVPKVLGDDRLLGQVILNLVLNALHAIPDDREELGEVCVSTALGDGGVEIRVRDDGTGISDDVFPHIFDPFFTTKEKGRGTGLGLAVTHQLVLQHRGSIEVNTGPDGTEVTVVLPALEKPE